MHDLGYALAMPKKRRIIIVILAFPRVLAEATDEQYSITPGQHFFRFEKALAQDTLMSSSCFDHSVQTVLTSCFQRICGSYFLLRLCIAHLWCCMDARDGYEGD